MRPRSNGRIATPSERRLGQSITRRHSVPLAVRMREYTPALPLQEVTLCIGETVWAPLM